MKVLFLLQHHIKTVYIGNENEVSGFFNFWDYQFAVDYDGRRVIYLSFNFI